MQAPVRAVAAVVFTFVAGPALSVSPGPAAPPPDPGTLFLHPERFVLEDGSFGTAERGLLFVPVRRDQGGGDGEGAARSHLDVLSIELYRFPAQEGVPAGRPPLFVLNGGPGFRGVAPDLAEPGFYEREILPRTAFADVVVVGQRGIGSSRPDTICEPAPFPYLMGKNCREFWEEQGLDLMGFTVVEAAADVADLAEALGYEKVALSGGSFGSHWAMAVMRYHPEIVARALLTGMEGPDHTYDMPGGILAALERMAAAAESSPELEGRLPEEGLVAAFVGLMDRLKEGPASVELEHPESGESVEVELTLPEVQRMVLSMVGSRGGVARLPAALADLARGDFTRAARAKLERQSGDEERPQRYRTASFFLLDCGSGISAERLETLNADPAIPVVGNSGSFYQAVCSAWPTDLGEEFRAGFDTDIPTVVVHGTWDTSTPYENALELMPRFGNGRLVTVEGGSHGALGEAIRHSPEFLRELGEFLAEGDMDGIPDTVELPSVEWEVPGG